MKKQTLAACVCAAIALCMFSCDWFGNKVKPPVSERQSLIGKWQVIAVKDSTKHAEDHGFFSFDGFNADSTKIFASFYTDSILIMASSEQRTDTSKYYIDSPAQKIFVKSKDKADSIAIVTLNDSLMWVTKDSIYIKLKKQP
jgi:hypothetical protein